MEPRRYGLLLPEPPGPSFDASRNVFGDGDDDDADAPPPSFAPGEKLRRKALAAQERLRVEDPTVYQYDEVYESKGAQADLVVPAERKKPRYVEKLLLAADRRKRENERRTERQVQKEREAEGDEFADRDSFVTSAYRKRLEELRAEEDEERRRQRLEEMCDVTKQRDLGGFYRHLYRQRLDVREETASASAPTPATPPAEPKKRTYRKRERSEERDERETADLPPDVDADSDFSVDDSASESETGETDPGPPPPPVTLDVTGQRAKKEPKEEEEESEPETKEAATKADIWKKRTVGEAFLQAVLRYRERKSAAA